MLFELTLLGLAYCGSKTLKSDGKIVGTVRDISGAVKSFLQKPQPQSVPQQQSVAQQQPLPIEDTHQHSILALQKHYRDISIFSAGALTLRQLVPMVAPIAGPLGFAAYVYGLAPHLRSMEQTLRQKRAINVDCLFLFADILALCTGSYIAASVSLYLIQAGKLGVLQAKDSSRKHIQHLFRELPRMVWVARDGVDVEMPLESVRQGDIVVLHAGKVIPVDGTIVEGYAGIDQQSLTGESMLAEKGPGDHVFANTILVNGRILVQVEKSGSDTTANQIADILCHSIDYKSQNQLKGERWANLLTKPMFYSSLVLLPIAGPVSTSVFINSHIGMRIRILAPMTTLKHISIASKKGLLVKDGRALEKFLEIDTILFDKTGTLTHAAPEVAEIVSSGGYTTEEVLRYAAMAEQKLAHPIARAILNKAQELNVSFPNIDDSCYAIGYGIKVDCAGETIQAGSLRYFEVEGIAIAEQWLLLQDKDQYAGTSFIFLAVDQNIIGALQIRPRIRPDMAEVIATLRGQGIRYMAIVSGDREAPTQLLAEQLGMDGAFANVLPQQKAEIVAQLQAEGKKVCFVGDGINDSIALKQADVSISLAGADTIAKDMAEIVLMDGDISSISDLHDISTELDKQLARSLQLSIAPGAINLLGAFLLHFNTLASLLVNGSFGIYGALKVMPAEDAPSPMSVQSKGNLNEPH